MEDWQHAGLLTDPSQDGIHATDGTIVSVDYDGHDLNIELEGTHRRQDWTATVSVYLTVQQGSDYERATDKQAYAKMFLEVGNVDFQPEF